MAPSSLVDNHATASQGAAAAAAAAAAAETTTTTPPPPPPHTKQSTPATPPPQPARTDSVQRVGNPSHGSGSAWPSWLPTSPYGDPTSSSFSDPSSSSSSSNPYATGYPAVLASSQSSISSSSTTTLLHEEPAAIAADAPTTPAAAAPVAQFPPWRVPLEEALAANERADSAHLYASLATIKPFGRPANRTVFFRGFLSDLDGDFDTSYKQHHLGALSNVIMFATDIRSGSVEDLVHGSKFGEVCWFLPNTREQFRLSGQLHLVVSPTHSLSTAHRIPAAPFSSSARFPPLHPDWWEQRRLDVWRHLSSVRRASFSWPKSHTHLVAATTSTASAAPFGAAAPPPAVATASGGADNAAPAPPRIVERGLASEVVAAQRTAVVTHLGADEASAPIAPAATTAAAADSTAAGSPGTVGPAPAAPSVTRASAESLEVDPSPVPAAATGDSQQAQSSSDSSGSSCSSSSGSASTAAHRRHHSRGHDGAPHRPPVPHDAAHHHQRELHVHFQKHAGGGHGQHHHHHHHHAAPAQQHQHHPHQVALGNFCLLLLDVDGADHLRLLDLPHTRTKYRRSTDAYDEEEGGGGDDGESVGSGSGVFGWVGGAGEEGMGTGATTPTSPAAGGVGTGGGSSYFPQQRRRRSSGPGSSLLAYSSSVTSIPGVIEGGALRSQQQQPAGSMSSMECGERAEKVTMVVAAGGTEHGVRKVSHWTVKNVDP